MRLFALIVALLSITSPAFAQGDGETTESDETTESTDTETTEAEEPKAEEAEAEEPKAEEAEAEEPKAEEAVDEEPKAEEAVDEKPKAEKAVDEKPKAEKAVDEKPKAEKAVAEEPKTEEAAAEEPKAEEAMMAAAPKVVEGGCTYDDLKGEFTITVPCDLLADHTGNSQPLKRIWLGAPEGQLNVMEVPEPYRTVEIDVVMGNLGRFWTSISTPEPAHATTLGGLDARVVTERKLRTLTRHWVMSLNGRNVTVKIAAYEGTHSARTAWLAKVSEALEAGFVLQ